MANAEGSYSFGSEAIQGTGQRVNRWKPEQKSYRVHFMSQDVVLRQRHFKKAKPGAGYYHCTQNTGYCPICTYVSEDYNNRKALRKSETFGTYILVYKTDAAGKLLQPLDGEIVFWAFGVDKFQNLGSIQAEWGALDTIDLICTVTDSKFQKMSFTPARGCALKDAGDEAFAQKINDDYQNALKTPLENQLCRNLDPRDLAQAFGVPYNGNDPEPGPTTPAFEQVSQPVQQASQSVSQQSAPQQFTQQEQTPTQSLDESFSDLFNL